MHDETIDTVGQAISVYFKHCRDKWSDSTIKTYDSLRNLVLSPWHYTPLDDLEVARAQTWFDELPQKGYSLRTAQVAHSILRGTVDHLQRYHRFYGPNPFAIAKPDPARFSRVEQRPIPTSQEISQMLDWAQDCGVIDWFIWIRLALNLGTRPSETCNICYEDIDTHGRRVRIRGTKTQAAARVVAMPETLSKRLEGRKKQVSMYKNNGHWEVLTGRVFDSTWNKNKAARVFKQMVTQLGMNPAYTPHSLRHYLAARLLAKGESPTQVAIMLGHSNDQLVRKLYGNHIQADAQARLAQSVAEELPREGVSN